MSDETNDDLPRFERVPGADGARAWKALDTARARNKLDMSSWFFDYDGTNLDELMTPEHLAGNCGTTACLAGWTVAQAGYSMMYSDPFADYEAQVYDKAGERIGSVPAVAADLLRIPRPVADALFMRVGKGDLDVALTQVFGPRPEQQGESSEA